MVLDDLTLGQLKQLRAMLEDAPACQCDKDPRENRGLCLVVADRGHVWLGRVVVDGQRVHITGARTVRRWGTTQGLNQLVDGPTAETRIDAPADVCLERRAMIATIPVKEAAWNGK